jgi:lysophospholipase L1-like esterase
MPLVASHGANRRHWAVTPRRRRQIAAVAAALVACCLAISLWAVARAREAGASRAVSSVQIEPRPGKPGEGRPLAGRPAMLSVSAPLGACEARIKREPSRLPTVAVVGASYTAGTGPGNPEQSWAVGLARLLRWNAVIYGVPGAGYAKASSSGRGPMSRMLDEEALPGLSPQLVVVQAGHDDSGVPPGLEGQRVNAAVRQIRTAAPAARIALLTTFASTLPGSPGLRRTDAAIMSAGRAADPGVIVLDPLAGRWSFPRAADGLHPTAAGDAWIARTVESALLARGVRPAPASAAAPVICDVSVGVGKPASATA